MRGTVAIEPCVVGFAIQQRGTEKVWVSSTEARLIPSYYLFHFPTIDAARDFCWACGFTWSVRVSP